MTCRTFQSLLESFADNELDPSQVAQAREHLKSCDICREEYTSTLALKQLLSTPTVPDPDPGYWDEVTDLILARSVRSTSEYFREPGPAARPGLFDSSLTRATLSVAASLAILFMALFLGETHESQADRIAMTEQAMIETSSMVALINSDSEETMWTPEDQQRLTGCLTIMGPPGMMGRLTDLSDLTGVE
ncbi:MAG: zf-HC2 domain-containing protein [candidate division Zixibacteria bacterium]|nr:zf-HC2 domain-containing protein [candidate division Zixibacteria bacterium]